MRRLPTFLIALFVLAAAPLWAVNAADIDWIGGLPSVSMMTSTTSNGKVVRTYTVASGRSFYTGLERGLTSRGWTISTRPTVQGGGQFIGAMVATRNGEVLHLSMAGGFLTAELSGGGAAQGERPTSHATVTGAETVGSLTINDSHTHRTLNMNGELTLNASHCKLTLSGRCTDLVINGSHNEVVVNGRVEQITLNGSYNKVSWSRAGNGGRTPAVTDNSTRNSTTGF